MKTRLFTFICIWLLTVNIVTAEENSLRPIVLSLPDLNWALEISAPGFSMEGFEIAPHGNAVGFHAGNKKTGVIISGFLEKAPKKGKAKDCRSYYWAKAQKSPFPKTDIKMSESGEMAIVEYLVKEYFRGREFNIKNLNAYMAESDYWIDIHLSKGDYKPGDQQLFEAVLSGVRIKKNYKPDSLMLFHYGNLFYWQKKYSKAIPYYQQALNLENNDKAMPKRSWFVLVDQLGMSYGMSGDVENAKKIFNTAISKEPEYPMFYYNLACACAESDDLEGAIKNLKLAYKYKKNIWKPLPNPRNDSSFKKYINTEKFKAVLNQIDRSTNQEPFKYTGKEVYDSQLGLHVKPNKRLGIVTATSVPHDYTIIIPYSEEWQIWSDPKIPFYAYDQDSGQIITIKKFNYPETSTAKHLHELLQNLKNADKLIIKDPAVIEREGHNILRCKANYEGAEEAFKGRNTWSWNYWIAIMKKSKWYVVHWSKTDEVFNSEGAENEELIYRMLTFFADSMTEDS